MPPARSLIAVFLIALGIGSAQAREPVGEAVQFPARDGVTIFGDFYPAASKGAPFILCFHMARSNRGEYSEIAPRLITLGFQVLAIDQRSGGYSFDRANETAKAYGKVASFSEVMPDVEAAMAWAKQRAPASKLLLWGSSYSAELVIVAASQHPEVDGVLSFSPGEDLGAGTPVADAAAKMTQPIFITSSRPEADALMRIVNAIGSADKTHFIPKGYGAHGSGALWRPAPEPEEYWRAIGAFLAKFK